MKRLNIVVMAGTRPEVIKLAPLVHHLRSRPEISTSFVTTGQHRDVQSQVAEPMGLSIDETLNVESKGQPLGVLYGDLTAACAAYFAAHRPDLAICHGDTASAAAGGLAAFLSGIPFCHVEAGLRSDDLVDPFPEEFNRRYLAPLAAVHYAPDREARFRLLGEGVSDRAIKVVGNTIVDAVAAFGAQSDHAAPSRPSVLVTLHRRETSHDNLRSLMLQLRDFAAQHPKYSLVYPLHMNPTIQSLAQECLGDLGNVTLMQPLSYPKFLAELARASLVVTDSGGVQEEAALFGTPTIVARQRSERTSGFATGRTVLLGDRLLADLMTPMLKSRDAVPDRSPDYRNGRISVSQRIGDDMVRRFVL